MVQLPRLWLWVGAIEVREKGSVGQAPQTRSVIGQDVKDSWEIKDTRNITKMALVQRPDAQQISGGARRGGGPLGAPTNRGRVVTAHFKIGLRDVDNVSEDVRMRDGSRELQIGVRDVAAWVFPRD